MAPLASLQMEYSLFSRDAEQQGQIEACKELGIAMLAYAVLRRGMLSAAPPKPEQFEPDDIRARLPRLAAPISNRTSGCCPLANEHDEALATRHPGIDQVALQHRVALRR